MSTRRQIPKRGSLKSSFTPPANPLKTRGFGKGIQARSAQLPKANPLQTRPFGSPISTSAQHEKTQSASEQLEIESRFDYNGLDVPVNASGTPSPLVQRKEGELENSNEMSRVAPILNGLNQFKVQQLSQQETVHLVPQIGGSQVQRQSAPAPAPGVFAPNSSAPPPKLPQSESERIISNIHGLWMKEMLERLSALDKTKLKDILNTVDRVRGINVSRTRIAIEAALGIKFSQSSINWLDKNASPGGCSTQVIEIRDFMKPDAFDQAASTLLAKVTQQIQQSYKKAIQDNQNNVKDSKKTTSPPALPAKAQQDLEKLKILSPLAAIQLQAVINAQGYLSMSNTEAHESAAKAAGLTLDQEWCGGFVVTNYIPLKLSTQLKGVFWSTPKLLDFFTYQHGYDPYRWIKVGDEYPEVKTYHEKRGSLRKWLTADQIQAGGELDIRPGDIVLQDNRKGTNADHIQMVQSWEPATQTLFTIDGNGGGYQVDNRPIAKANKDKPRRDDKKRKAVETATGYRLRPGGRGGVVGLGSYNLSEEPTEQEVKETRKKGKKIVRIVGIGRPSLVDFETQRYLKKLPPKAKKNSGK